MVDGFFRLSIRFLTIGFGKGKRFGSDFGTNIGPDCGPDSGSDLGSNFDPALMWNYRCVLSDLPRVRVSPK